MENKMKKTIDGLLVKLYACQEAKDWAKGKTFEEVYTTCKRGDWLNWLFDNTNPEDVELLTLVKGHQANTVRHLMRDDRSLKAVDTAIKFGEGRATEEDLSEAAEAADAAYIAAARYAETAAARAAYASCTATQSSYAAACAAHAAARAAYIAYEADYAGAAAAAVDARKANRQLTAEIFRQYISIEKFKI